MEKKAPLKKRNPYKYYRNAYAGCVAGEVGCILTPIIAIFGAKWNEYFVVVSSGERVKLSIGCVLAMIVGAFMMYRYFRHKERVEQKTSMLTFVIGVGVAFVIAYLCKVIADDLVLILGSELAGLTAAYGVEQIGNNMRAKRNLYKDALDKYKAEQIAKEIVDGENNK